MAGVMQSAMVASPLIYLAAEDMTRGVNAILLEEKNLLPGSIALMTTSDVKMLDGADTALDKVALRGVGAHCVTEEGPEVDQRQRCSSPWKS